MEKNNKSFFAVLDNYMYKDLYYTRSLKEYNYANTKTSMKIFLLKKKII